MLVHRYDSCDDPTPSWPPRRRRNGLLKLLDEHRFSSGVIYLRYRTST